MKKYIKSDPKIERIRKSGEILSMVLKELAMKAKPGVKTIDLDTMARELIEKYGGSPAFLGYKPEGALNPFPFTLCASVNDVVVHGWPSTDILKDGDVLKLDLGVNWKGGISDSAVTVPVGKTSKEAQYLINTTRVALDKAIEVVKPGNTLGDIGYIIEKTVEEAGLTIIDGLTGHGVGDAVHEDPIVYNFGERGEGVVLSPGMVIAIEPMTSLGGSAIKQRKDDSFVTKDGSLSAQFEHTILVTATGREVLTR